MALATPVAETLVAAAAAVEAVKSTAEAAANFLKGNAAPGSAERPDEDQAEPRKGQQREGES